MKTLKKILYSNENAIHCSIHDPWRRKRKYMIESDLWEERDFKNWDSPEGEPLHEHLKKHYDKLHQHSLAIHQYSNNSAGVNQYLWDRHHGKNRHQSFYPDDVHDQIHGMDETLKQHRTPGDMLVWSRTLHNPLKIQNENGIVHHPAFMSTTTDKKYAEKFRVSEQKPESDGLRHQHVLQVAIPKGHHGAYIAHQSLFPSEREFILPRGLNLKIHHTNSYIVQSEAKGFTREKHMVHLHEASIVK